MTHPLIATGIKLKREARAIQELTMTRRARKQPMTLEVHSMFEPNREAPHLLHTAYTFLLPSARRHLLAPARTKALSPQTQEQVGERKLP
jgi:hypothetical protein